MFLDMFRVSLYTAVGAEACGDRKVAKEALDTAAKVILVAGIREKVKEYFDKNINILG